MITLLSREALVNKESLTNQVICPLSPKPLSVENGAHYADL